MAKTKEQKFKDIYEVREFFYDKIDEALTDWFITVQDAFGIEYGDTSPLMAMALETRERMLANAMALVIAEQGLAFEKDIDGADEFYRDNDIPVFMDEVKGWN